MTTLRKNSIVNDDDGVEIGTFEGSRVHCCPQYTSDLEAKMNPEEVHSKGFALEQRKESPPSDFEGQAKARNQSQRVVSTGALTVGQA